MARHHESFQGRAAQSASLCRGPVRHSSGLRRHVLSGSERSCPDCAYCRWQQHAGFEIRGDYAGSFCVVPCCLPPAYNICVFSRRKLVAYFAGLSALALLVAALSAVEAHLSQTSIALCFVLLVVIAAVFLGRFIASVIAILAGLSFNYFFLEPRHTLRINSAQDVIAFLVLIATAIIVGQLSARAEKRAIQAETRKLQLE